jgi:RNA polymerase sigma factor (sigma-70 family)
MTQGEYLHFLATKYYETPSNDYKEKVVKQADGLVKSIARQYTGLAEMDDLVAEGYAGLTDAINKFNPKRGQFSTIATSSIQGYIKHYLRDNISPIRPPSWVFEKKPAFRRTRAKLREQYKREPTKSELMKATGLTFNMVKDLVNDEDSPMIFTNMESLGVVAHKHAVDYKGRQGGMSSNEIEMFEYIKELVENDTPVTTMASILQVPFDKARTIKKEFTEYIAETK